MFMKNKVLYWDRIVGDDDLLKRHKPLILKLIRGDYEAAHLDLKKVKGHRVYSVWTEEKADRLLFVTEDTENHGRCMLLLGEVPNHDYQKSPFMKPAVLSAFIENKASTLVNEAIIFEDTDILPFEKNKEAPKDDFDAYPLTFHNQQFISLDINQQETKYVPFPVLINGVIGSGKTLCAEYFLANQLDPNTPKKLLYITQSNGLVFEREKQWLAHPSAQQNHSEVSFKTFETLVKYLYPHLKEHAIATIDTCLEWLHNYKKRFPLRSTVNDTLYQEFRILAAFDKKSYLNLGENQSLMKDPIEKGEIYEAFQLYKKHLIKEKRLDPSLFQFNQPIEPIYDLIIVDEAQDFSHIQLQQLQKLARNNCIVYCMDSNQSLHDATSKLSYLTTLTYPNKPVEFFNSYRCPEPIVQFNNHFLNIKFKLTGGLSDKKEHSSIKTLNSNKPCYIDWVDLPIEVEQTLPVLLKKYKNLQPLVEKYPFLLPILENHSYFAPLFNEDENLVHLFDGETHRAIITLPQHKGEVKKLFNTTLVFTAQEIKGLEFDTIINYQTLNKPVFKKANDKLASIAKSEDTFFKSTVHLPKSGGGENIYVTAMNELVSNNGRSTHKLYYFQRKEHKLHTLIEEIKEGLKNHQNKSAANTIKTPKLTWWQRFITLVEAKKLEQAHDTFVKLQNSNELFDNLYQYISTHLKHEAKKEKPSSWDVFKTQIENNQYQKARQTYETKLKDSKELFDYICALVHPKKEEVVSKPLETKKVTNTNSDVVTKPSEIPKVTNTKREVIQEKTPPKIQSNKPTLPVSQAKKQPIATNNNRLEIPKKAISHKLEENSGPELTCNEQNYLLDLVQNNTINKKKFARFFKDKKFDYLMFEANLTVEDKRFPFFIYLINNTTYYPLLIQFLDEYKFLAKKITPERVCNIFDFTTNQKASFKNGSILLALASPTKHALFGLLLANNDKLAEGITAEALCRKALLFINGISTKTDTHEGDFSTSLHFLTIELNSIIHLAFILKKNPLQIPAITLFEDPFILKKELLPPNSEIIVTTLNPAFYNLCNYKIGIEVLELIFNNNPCLFQEITANELCKPRIESEEFEKKHINITPLFLLSSTLEGRQFLLQLFTKNTTLAESIPQEQWFLEARARDTPNGRTPAGYIYSSESDLKDLVHHIICGNNIKQEMNSNLALFPIDDTSLDETTYLNI